MTLSSIVSLRLPFVVPICKNHRLGRQCGYSIVPGHCSARVPVMTSQANLQLPPPPTENTPLLQPVDDISAQQNRTTTSDTPIIVTEPSTRGLVLVLGSIWIGVFLAALGIDSTADFLLSMVLYIVTMKCQDD
jgi:hypothetical protein